MIAILDDDDAILDALGLVVQDLGYEVSCYATATEFISDAKDACFDLLVLDPHLADMSGADAMRKTNLRLPVIVLTARPVSPVVDELKALGLTNILTKPASAEQLAIEIEKMLPSS